MNESRRLLRVCAAIWAVSLLLRGGLLVRETSRLLALRETPDSIGYLSLAHGDLFDNSRTPGYPLFLHLLLDVAGASPLGVLWLQCVALAAASALTAGLAGRLLPGSRSAPWIAGLVSALSFTGLTAGYRILSEAVFVPLVLGAFVLLERGLAERRPALLALASASAGLAFLVKPVFAIWPVLAVVLVALLDRSREGRAGRAALAAGPAAAVVVLWVLVVKARYGITAPSTIALSTAYEYWGARTLAYATSPGTPATGAVLGEFEALQREAKAETSLLRRNELWRRRLGEILRAHPADSVRALARNGWENLPRPFLAAELPFPFTRAGARAAGLAMTALLWAAAAAGAFVLVRSSPRAFFALATVFAAFALVTATSFWQGGRLMFPVEWVLHVLAGTAAGALGVRGARA